ncbi:MAG: hypothetical protein K2G22_02025, partial [Eubacterium sp.]|nr:hypothetical protein [Eubacterium sp.]
MVSKITKLFAVLFSVMLIFSATFAAEAKTASQLQSEKEKIQSEINASQQKINKLKAEKSQQQEYVAALQGKISLLQDKLDNLESQRDTLQSEIDAIQAKIDKTGAEIEEAQNQIEAKKAEIKEIYDLYCQRLRAMYISGNVTTLEVILDSGWDMSSILTRAEMVKSVSAQDNATLEELMNKMQEIENERQALAEKKLELDADKKTLDAQKAELQSSIDEISSSKSELDAEIAECNAAIKRLDSQTSEIRETIDTDQKRIQEIENEIKGAANSSAPSGSYTPGTGRLAYPTSYRTISAGYPNYSSGAYHGGIDFPCPTGTPVYAADSGYVLSLKHKTEPTRKG